MFWPGWVGAMYWFLMSLTSASLGVGTVVPPMINAVESSSDGSNDEHLLESAGSAYATAGVVATANPTPSATANAPTRPMYFVVLIVVPPSMSRRNEGHRGGSSSAMGIVTRVRCDEPSSAPLLSRPVSARYYLAAELPPAACPDGRVARRPRLQRLGRDDIAGPATQPWCGRRASVALAAAALCRLLRRQEFRFGNAVQAGQVVLG